VTWFWVKQYQGRQADVARYLRAGRDQAARWYLKAVETIEELEPVLQKVADILPEEEPLLAKGSPERVNINVEFLED
jgi:hypothetical protein